MRRGEYIRGMFLVCEREKERERERETEQMHKRKFGDFHEKSVRGCKKYVLKLVESSDSENDAPPAEEPATEQPTAEDDSDSDADTPLQVRIERRRIEAAKEQAAEEPAEPAHKRKRKPLHREIYWTLMEGNLTEGARESSGPERFSTGGGGKTKRRTEQLRTGRTAEKALERGLFEMNKNHTGALRNDLVRDLKTPVHENLKSTYRESRNYNATVGVRRTIHLTEEESRAIKFFCIHENIPEHLRQTVTLKDLRRKKGDDAIEHYAKLYI